MKERTDIEFRHVAAALSELEKSCSDARELCEQAARAADATATVLAATGQRVDECRSRWSCCVEAIRALAANRNAVLAAKKEELSRLEESVEREKPRGWWKRLKTELGLRAARRSTPAGRGTRRGLG